MTRSTRRRLLATGTATLGILLAGCSGDGDGDGDSDGGGDGDGSGGTTHTVEMTDEFQFEPDSLTAAPGDTVVWENVGSIGHTVTGHADEIPSGAAYFASGGYESEEAARTAYNDDRGGEIAGGETYEHTFSTEGTHAYVCIPHEAQGMDGRVIVEDG